MKQAEKFRYLGSLIISHRSSDDEIKKIGTSKIIFKKMGNLLKSRQLSMETKLRILDCYTFSTLNYGGECWTARRKLVETIRKRQSQFLGHILRREGLDDVAITGKIEGKRARGRQRLTFTLSLSHWMKISDKRNTENSKRVMENHGLQRSGTTGS